MLRNLAVTLCLAATGAVAGAASLDLPSDILRYYAAYNEVVTTSTPADRAAVFRYIDAGSRGTSFPKDAKLSRLHRVIVELESRELHVDPGIFRPLGAHPVFQFLIEPVEVLGRTADTIMIATRRIPHDRVETGVPVARDRRSRQGSFTEFQSWVRIDGRWMIDAVRICPI